MSTSTSPRIAISLGASFLGYATHAGFLARLHKLGIRPVRVAGSSAGAIAAGLYAAGLDSEVIKNTVLSWKLRRAFASGTPWWSHYFRVSFNSVHISAMHPRGAVELLEALVNGRRIEDLRNPSFMAAVTDLAECQTSFLRKGSLAEAMVASCCMPTLISPLIIDGIHCFDGGIAHETPIDPWLDDGEVDLILVHRISHPPSRPLRFFPFNLFNTPGRVLACAGEQLLEYRRKLAAFHGKRFILSHTFHARPSMFRNSSMADFYAVGEAQAQRLYEDELKPLLGG